jgi:hypothetical protein
MDERGANIDIVFRNGLKDFEVLPPPEVWNNIPHIIKKGPRPFIYIRVAALITVLLTLGFLAYILNREIVTGLDNAVTALNSETVPQQTTLSVDKPPFVKVKKSNTVANTTQITFDASSEKPIEPVRITSPETASLQETNSMIMSGELYRREPILPFLNTSGKKSFEITEPGQLKYEEPDQLKYTDISTIKTTERWSVAAMASPTYFSRFNSDNSELSKQLMASQQTVISYTGGVAFTFKINKRFSIQSGLYYSSLGQEVTGINSYAGFQTYFNTKGSPNFQVLTTNGTISTNNADVFIMSDGPADRIQTSYTKDVFDPQKASLLYINNTMHQNFSYLELPVLIRYKLVDKMVDLNLIGGVSYNLLVNNSVYTIVDGGKYPIGQTQGLNTISLSSSLGMGMEYNFSSNLSLNLEPTFRYYLNPFNEALGSKIHPYSFGIFSGLSYKF